MLYYYTIILLYQYITEKEPEKKNRGRDKDLDRNKAISGQSREENCNKLGGTSAGPSASHRDNHRA